MTENKFVVDPQDVEKNKTMAVLAYFLFFLPLLTDAKDSKFAKFHANQSLILVLACIGWSVVSALLTPILGLLLLMIAPFFGLAVFIFWLIGLINALNGKMKELPIIGQIHILDK